MRAKTVNEIQKFERGNDPKHSMNIGKIAGVKKLLDEIYETGKKYATYQYEIKSLDRIEIRYSDLVKKDILDSKNPQAANYLWIIKYVEKDRYVSKEESHEMSSSTHSFGTSYEWNIYEVKFNMASEPERIEFKEEYLCDLSRKNKINQERVKIIVDALNQHYGKLGGFELIEKTKDES